MLYINRSFTMLNITQFLGAINDNIYKLTIIFLFIQLDGIDKSAVILSSAGAVFVIPFLLFSAAAGVLADKRGKRNIIVATKFIELTTTALGLLAFYLEDRAFLYFLLFALATQSALFSPAKYGIIPEIVEKKAISAANGMLATFTFAAIIIGSFLASFILDISDRNYMLSATLCFLFSLAGLYASLKIEMTLPAGSQQSYKLFFPLEIFKSLRKARHIPSLLLAIVGSSFFLFLGAYVQLNIIPYGVQELNLTDVQGGYLFFITAFGISCGALLAAKLATKERLLKIVPCAAIGIAATLFALGSWGENLFYVLTIIFLLGLFGGLYQIPLDIFMQVASPPTVRGQMIAAANFLSFVGVLLATFMIYLLNSVLALTAAEGFLVFGVIAAFIAIDSFRRLIRTQ